MNSFRYKSICVFCSSSEHASANYFAVAKALGAELGRRGIDLIFGGTKVGLMREVADSARAHGAGVIGIVPRSMKERGIAYDHANELIITETLRERKALMDTRADAFVAMPGGIGTLEEVMEVLTLKQLQVHTKPIVLLNVDGFYNPLMDLLERMIEQRVAKAEVRQLWHAAPNVEDVFRFLDGYQPPSIQPKWT